MCTSEVCTVVRAMPGCRSSSPMGSLRSLRYSTFTGAPDLDAARLEMETNYFGTLAMCRAFAPVLAANGGGALVNILSVVSWLAVPFQGSYAASKSATWALTNAIRVELRRQGTQVTGIF